MHPVVHRRASNSSTSKPEHATRLQRAPVAIVPRAVPAVPAARPVRAARAPPEVMLLRVVALQSVAPPVVALVRRVARQPLVARSRPLRVGDRVLEARPGPAQVRVPGWVVIQAPEQVQRAG